MYVCMYVNCTIIVQIYIRMYINVSHSSLFVFTIQTECDKEICIFSISSKLFLIIRLARLFITCENFLFESLKTFAVQCVLLFSP